MTHPKRAWVEQIMGMPISIHLRGPQVAPDGHTAPAAEVEKAVAQAFSSLRRVDEVFSTYQPGSQISRLQRGEVSLARCDAEVRDVVRLCEEARESTQGWFDARYAGVFDPTGLVKGWAVQRACAELADALPEIDVMVNAGGDVAVSCGRGDTPPWRLGIENPLARTELVGTVELRSGGLATSGTAARGEHIHSPRTGRPAAELASVSVSGPSLMWADVFATAAFARGPDCVDWLRTLLGHSWLVVALDGTVTSSSPTPPAA